MTIAIKPTASGSTIEQDGSTILSVDSSGNITPSNQMYPKVPAFNVSLSADQSISSGVFTKVAFDNVKFDTNSYWDATNYRYTPQVAGYYQFNATIRNRANGNLSNSIGSFFKNGSEYNRLSGSQIATLGQIHGPSGGMVVYLNGSTDYVEVYGQNSTSTNNRFGGSGGGVVTVFSGVLVSV
ncbi:MAG: C1q-like domain-containing protein [Cyanophyceae cyanobacterium]